MYFPTEFDNCGGGHSADDFKQSSTLDELVHKVDFLIEENQKNKDVIRALLKKMGIELEGF